MSFLVVTLELYLFSCFSFRDFVGFVEWVHLDMFCGGYWTGAVEKSELATVLRVYVIILSVRWTMGFGV